MTLAVSATIAMSFFIVLLLGCVDLHHLRCAASGCRTEIGCRLRRTTKLPFRKLNSISSKQMGEQRRSARLRSFKTLNSVYPDERMQTQSRKNASTTAVV